MYDGLGIFSSVRAQWMLNYFGNNTVWVLNGGLKKWKAEGRPLVHNVDQVRLPEIDEAAVSKGDYSYTEKHPERVIRDINEMHKVARELYHGSTDGPVQVLDNRPPIRFNSEVPEPRPGVRSGKIPNSINVFFNDLINEDGTYKSDEELTALFKSRGVNFDSHHICSCGSGVTATIVELGLRFVGAAKRPTIWDGSWSEYGAVPEPDFSKK